MLFTLEKVEGFKNSAEQKNPKTIGQRQATSSNMGFISGNIHKNSGNIHQKSGNIFLQFPYISLCFLELPF